VGPHATSTDLQKALDELTRTICWAAVAGVQDGSGLRRAASGLADLFAGTSAMPRHCFRAGSVTKTFVAAVILQLAAEGTLGLDQPMTRWLPSLVKDDRVTIRQLLNHTSGLPNFTETMPLSPADLQGARALRAYSPTELIRIAMTRDPDFAPGRGWHYSNTNYVLAALVAERVTGQRYEDAIRSRILDPLGLTDTRLPGSSPALPAPHLRSYVRLQGKTSTRILDVTIQHPSRAWGSGDIISTAGDLVSFLRALLGGKVVPQAQLKELTTTVPGDSGREYGLGVFATVTEAGTVTWGYTGAFGGYLTVVQHSVERDATVAISVTPRAPGAVDRVRAFCSAALDGS
jgi:D-alanyl-D-alanine carboxypeptidase